MCLAQCSATSHRVLPSLGVVSEITLNGSPLTFVFPTTEENGSTFNAILSSKLSPCKINLNERRIFETVEQRIYARPVRSFISNVANNFQYRINIKRTWIVLQIWNIDIGYLCIRYAIFLRKIVSSFLSINTLTATTPVFGSQESFWSGRVTHIRESLISLPAKGRRRYLKRYSIIIKLLNCYKSNTKMVY